MKFLITMIFFLISFNTFAIPFVIPEINTKFASLDVSIAAIEALADGKILMGNGSGAAAEVTPSGDVTMTNAGVNAIAAGIIVNADVNASAAVAYSKLNLTGAVLEADLLAPTTDALLPSRTLRATYDFAVDGGAESTIGSGITLPDNAIVTYCFYDVATTFTSGGADAATIAINIPTDGDLQTAIAISDGTNPYDAGLIECDTKGTDPGDPATFIKTTAAREISWVIAGGQAVTAGKLQLFLQYVVSD